MRLSYLSSSSAIKDYSSSVIARSERNDCVVRAIASASDWDYDKAHSFVAKYFKRVSKKGTRFFNTTMSLLSKGNKRINRKKITTISNGEMMNGKSKMTVGAFVKLYKKGSYVVTVNGHAFTVKDGIVIGNIEDSIKKRRILKGAWKIGTN